MNKILIFAFWLLVFGFFSLQKVEAQNASDSGTTENLKKRIEKLVEEKRDQIEGVLSELGTKKRAFIGEVQRVSEESITVKGKKGTEIIPLDGVSLRKTGKEIAVKDIAVGDWVVVLGYIDSDTFQARRISVSATSLRPDPQIVEVGTITGFDKTSFTLLTRGTTESITVTTNKETLYQDIEGNEIERIDITKDTQALVVGFEKDSDKTATIIRVLTVVDDSKAN